MLLNKLESGFLLFKTPQGLVAVEPSFWERVYLLWTFRNFRQLSPLLLNPRQTAMINKLFFQHAAVVADGFNPCLQIGVVENFVPPAIAINAAPAAITDAAPPMTMNLPEQAAGQIFAPEAIPIVASPAVMADEPPVNEEEVAGIDLTGIARKNILNRSFSPVVSWLRPRSWNLPVFKLVVPRPQVSRPVVLRFAAAIGALSLCVYFAVAFHRIGYAPGSPAHNPPPQLNLPDSPSASTPATVAENPAPAPEATGPDITDGETEVKTAPELPAEASTGRQAPVKTRVKPSPAKIAPSITTAQRTTTPDDGSHRTTARVARSSGGSRATAFLRVPTSTSTRRMTLPPDSSGALARSAQSYFDLAKRQMARGNYSAAAVNYQRAWRIEEISAAARGRLVRARRAMQAKNENIANRRQTSTQ